MELEKKLQLLERLREESLQNGNRINGACKTETRTEKSVISGFSVRLLLSVILFAALLTLDQSPNTQARKMADRFYQSVSVDILPEISSQTGALPEKILENIGYR